MEQRLIDANEYAKKVCTYQETGCGSCANQIYCPNNAPTVLTIPDNPTNGDMIKAMFPDAFKNEKYFKDCGTQFELTIDIVTRWAGLRFDKEWWSAPYKKEEKEDD